MYLIHCQSPLSKIYICGLTAHMVRRIRNELVKLSGTCIILVMARANFGFMVITMLRTTFAFVDSTLTIGIISNDQNPCSQFVVAETWILSIKTH